MAEKKTVGKKTEKRKAPAIKTSRNYSKIVLYPSMTEKIVRAGEQNKIAFIVSRASNKKIIKEAVENLYAVKVASVKTQILPDGRKRAYVRLTSEHNATELATKLGML